ncbi:MAG: hypothetical protein V3U60_11280 [Gammaproteobacteria bacterium]
MSIGPLFDMGFEQGRKSAEKEIETLTAEGAEKDKQIESLQQKVHLCAGYDKLTAENAALWELADEAVLTTLKMDKKVGAALIRFRTSLGLSLVADDLNSTDEDSQTEVIDES